MFRAFAVVGVAASLGGTPAQAQEAPAVALHRVSVDDAVSIALLRAETIDQAIARRQRAAAQEQVARAGFYPQVAGSASYQRTFASQFDALSGDTGAPSPFEGADLPFGQDNTWQVGLVASQDLWSGGAVRARTRIAEAALGSAELAEDQARAEVALDAAQAFYDARLADQLVAIASASLQAAERTLEITRTGFEVGVRPEFDVLRSEIEVQNQRVTQIRAIRQRNLAFLQLRQMLDLPDADALELVDTDTDVIPVATGLVGVEATDARVPVVQAERATEVARQSVRVARSAMLPAVGLDASAGWFAYPSALLPGLGEGVWHDDISASLAVQVPIFTGGRARGGVSSARADVAESASQLELVRELAALDQHDAESALEAARVQLGATEGAVQQARRAHEIAEVRFEEGLSTQVELTELRLALRQALANRAVAERDLQIARLRLALLPALPLGVSSGVAPSITTTGTRATTAGTTVTTANPVGAQSLSPTAPSTGPAISTGSPVAPASF